MSLVESQDALESYLPANALKKHPKKDLNTANWPPFDRSCLGEPNENNALHARFVRLELAIARLYAGDDLTSVARDIALLAPSRLTAIVGRALQTASDGEINGFQALVEGFRIGGYTRTAQISDNAKGSVGFAGAFEKLFRDNPKIQQEADDAIANLPPLGDKIRRSSTCHNEVFQRVMLACRNSGLTDADYPFCVRTKGQRSLRRYVLRRIAKNEELLKEWFGEGVTARLKHGTGTPAFALAVEPFDVAHIDAHRIDAITSVELQLNGKKPVRVALRRMWLIVVSDAVSKAILGYSLSFEEQVSAEDVEAAILCALEPWFPRELYPGLQYAKGSCLPNGGIASFTGCPIVMMKLDNALQHWGARIGETVRMRTGIHLQYGPVGEWDTNASLERTFLTLEERGGIHRLASTTGSGPDDPMRPKDFVRNAIDDKIDHEYVRDYIEVQITNFNAWTHSTLGGYSPIAFLKHFINGRIEKPFLRRPTPPHPRDPRLGCTRFDRTIQGSMKNGDRPYFQILGRKYSSKTICKDWEMVGRCLVVYMDHRTAIIKEVYLEGRQLLASIFQIGRRSHEPMSIAQRRADLSRANIAYINERVSVEQLMNDLKREAIETAAEKPYHINAAASQLIAVREADLTAHRIAAKAEAPLTNTEPDPMLIAVATANDSEPIASRPAAVLSQLHVPPAKPSSTNTPSSPTVIVRLPGALKPSFGNLARRTN